MDTETKFDQWAIVELLGHRRLAGRASEQMIAGAVMLRLDVPETEAGAAFTQFYGAGSIYCLTPTTEEIACKMAGYIRARPIDVFEMKQLQLPAGVRAGEDVDDHDEDKY